MGSRWYKQTDNTHAVHSPSRDVVEDLVALHDLRTCDSSRTTNSVASVRTTHATGRLFIGQLFACYDARQRIPLEIVRCTSGMEAQ